MPTGKAGAAHLAAPRATESTAVVLRSPRSPAPSLRREVSWRTATGGNR